MNSTTWIILILLVAYVARPINTTDSAIYSRSHMGLRIDNLTGCHYLAAFWGGLTPRLDAQGNHICIEEMND